VQTLRTTSRTLEHAHRRGAVPSGRVEGEVRTLVERAIEIAHRKGARLLLQEAARYGVI
jgi:hypothetical protein